MQELIQTRIIVLRKIPYQANGIIINTLSPDFGRIDFLVKGAKKISKKHFISIDLFRELLVEYRYNPNKSGALFSIKKSTLLSYYDDLAFDLDLISIASQASLFIIRTLTYNIHSPLLYKTFKYMLQCFISKENHTLPWIEIIKLTFLYENGLLERTNSGNKLQELVNFVITGHKRTPDITEEDLPYLKKQIETVYLQFLHSIHPPRTNTM